MYTKTQIKLLYALSSIGILDEETIKEHTQAENPLEHRSSLEEIFNDFGCDHPFTKKGGLTKKGERTEEEILEVLSYIPFIKHIDNIEYQIDEIIRIGG